MEETVGDKELLSVGLIERVWELNEGDPVALGEGFGPGGRLNWHKRSSEGNKNVESEEFVGPTSRAIPLSPPSLPPTAGGIKLEFATKMKPPPPPPPPPPA